MDRWYRLLVRFARQSQEIEIGGAITQAARIPSIAMQFCRRYYPTHIQRASGVVQEFATWACVFHSSLGKLLDYIGCSGQRIAVSEELLLIDYV